MPAPTSSVTSIVAGDKAPTATSASTPKSMESRRCRAILSYNTIDIRSVKKLVHFGTWNARPLDNKFINTLAKSFIKELVPFRPQSVFPIVLDPNDLNAECINSMPNYDGTAPRLQLAPNVEKIIFAGGHHRFEAIEKCIEMLHERVKQAEHKYKKALKSPEIEDKTPYEEKVRKERTLRKELGARLWVWGCVVYDSRVVDPRLGRYLSSNDAEVRAVADALEKFDGHILQISGASGPMEQREDIELFSKENSNYAQIFNNPKLVATLIRIRRLGRSFHMKTPMSVPWVIKQYIRIHGGFFMEIINYALSIHENLFSPVNVLELDDKKFDKYLAHITEKVEGSLKKNVQEFAECVWAVLTDEVPDFKERPFVDPLLEQFDKSNTLAFQNINDVLFQVGNDAYDDELKNYVETITKQLEHFRKHIKSTDSDMMKIKDDMDDKMSWYLVDHRDFHYAPLLPMLTPSLMVYMGVVFDSVPHAIEEFCSWICPMAWLDVRRAKVYTDIRDVSSVVIQTIEENCNQTFLEEGLETLKRVVAFFPLKHIATFHQLEYDLSVIGESKLERWHKVEEKQWAQMDMTAEEATKATEELAEWMYKNRRTIFPSWNRDVWSLNVEGVHKWRIASWKNMNRDLVKNARLALNENHVAMRYRPSLLQQSQAAAWLRQEFKKAVDPLCKPWKIFLDGKQKNLSGYQFPDMLNAPAIEKPPKIDMEGLKKKRTVSVVEDANVRDFATLLKKIQGAQYLRAVEGANHLDDKVMEAIDTLAQAGLVNIKRRANMQRELPETERATVNPYDKQFGVGVLSKEDLQFYTRVLGFTEATRKMNESDAASFRVRGKGQPLKQEHDDEEETKLFSAPGPSSHSIRKNPRDHITTPAKTPSRKRNQPHDERDLDSDPAPPKRALKRREEDP